jgi:hypothetical protein
MEHTFDEKKRKKKHLKKRAKSSPKDETKVTRTFKDAGTGTDQLNFTAIPEDLLEASDIPKLKKERSKSIFSKSAK